MSQGEAYFDYPHRRPGLDHARFEHRYLAKAKPITWPDGARLAVWVTVHLEFFPMDMTTKPFVPMGGMERMYPSFWDYTTRDYGNRVGIYRIMRVLDRHGVRATAAMNSEVARRYPSLVAEMLKRKWEIAASGVDMGRLHSSLLTPEQEGALVKESFGTLRRLSGQPVVGWHSPAHSQSAVTPDLVAANGAAYIADWINDDMPYVFKTSRGSLTAMPLSYELSDRKALFLHNQRLDEYEHQVGDAFEFLYREAGSKGGRILSLSLCPWMIGQASRIRALDRLLGSILSYAKVWPATGAEIMTAWKASTGQ